MSVTALSSSFEKMLSRSWITKRYGWPPGRASRNCWSVHSAVGCAVTLRKAAVWRVGYRIREEHAARFSYDVDAIYTDLMRLEAECKQSL